MQAAHLCGRSGFDFFLRGGEQQASYHPRPLERPLLRTRFLPSTLTPPGTVVSQRCRALCTGVTRTFAMDLAIHAASRRLSSTFDMAQLDTSAAFGAHCARPPVRRESDSPCPWNLTWQACEEGGAQYCIVVPRPAGVCEGEGFFFTVTVVQD